MELFKPLLKHNNGLLPDGYIRNIVIGSTGSGKTFFLPSILSNMAPFQALIIICPTAGDQQIYQTIINFYRPQGVLVLIGDKISDIKRLALRNSEIELNDHSVVIIDDFFDKKDLNDKLVKELFCKGRHKHLSVILLTQDYFEIPVILKRNSDTLAIFPIGQYKIIYRDVGGLFSSMDEFVKLYKEATKTTDQGDRSCLFLTLSPFIREEYKIRKGISPIIYIHQLRIRRILHTNYNKMLFDLDSDRDAVGSNKADLKLTLDRPIELNPNKRYGVRLVKGKLPFTIHNVSASIGNNSFRISVDNKVSYDEIKFDDGIHTTTGIINAMNYKMRLLDLYTKGSSPSQDKFPIYLTFNDITGLASFTLDNTGLTLESGDSPSLTNTHIDLTNDGNSTFYNLIGFAATDTDLTTTAVHTGSSDTDFFGSVGDIVDIRCNLVKSYNSSNQNEILLTHYWAHPANSSWQNTYLPLSTSDAITRLELQDQYKKGFNLYVYK